MNYYDMQQQEDERHARAKAAQKGIPTPKVSPPEPIKYKATRHGTETDFEVPTVTVECLFVYTDERPPELLHTEVMPRLPLSLLKPISVKIAKKANWFFDGNLSKWTDQQVDDEGRGYTSTTVYPANWKNKRRGLIRIRHNEVGMIKL